MVLTLKVNIYMSWIHLIFTIMTHGKVFDTIVIDPPSFARNKKKTFSVQKNYDDLINGALSILAPNGSLLLCTNSSTFSLKAFKMLLKRHLTKRV